jgi:predicted acylesterase/phospholipase RssA
MPDIGIAAKLAKTGPRKLLALDGGGIRGLISIEILAKMEELLGGGDPKFRLSHYFDYIAGTSTGAVIGTLLALGYSVEAVRQIYLRNAETMFDEAAVKNSGKLKNVAEQVKGGFIEKVAARLADVPIAANAVRSIAPDKQPYYKYRGDELQRQLKSEILKAAGSEEAEFGTDKLQTLLLLVLGNATTDSPWPLSNNPRAKYNERSRPDCNLKLPLWQLVRGSTAAPTYFPPEVIRVGDTQPFIYVDGGITPYNNPAMLLFLHATLDCYRLGWPAGENEMLLVSIGTGLHPQGNANLRVDDMTLLYYGSTVAEWLFNGALYQQDLLCRAFGRCLEGDPLDREVGDMKSVAAPGGRKLFTYVRYNAMLTQEALDALVGPGKIVAANVQQLDSTKATHDLRDIGRQVAERRVDRKHFANFPA